MTGHGRTKQEEALFTQIKVELLFVILHLCFGTLHEKSVIKNYQSVNITAFLVYQNNSQISSEVGSEIVKDLV